MHLTRRNLEEKIEKGKKQDKLIEELTIANEQKESEIQLLRGEKKYLTDKLGIAEYELSDMKE